MESKQVLMAPQLSDADAEIRELYLREKRIAVMTTEHRYVGERLQAHTMTMNDARAWLLAHGHTVGEAPLGEQKPGEHVSRHVRNYTTGLSGELVEPPGNGPLLKRRPDD